MIISDCHESSEKINHLPRSQRARWEGSFHVPLRSERAIVWPRRASLFVKLPVVFEATLTTVPKDPAAFADHTGFRAPAGDARLAAAMSGWKFVDRVSI